MAARAPYRCSHDLITHATKHSLVIGVLGHPIIGSFASGETGCWCALDSMDVERALLSAHTNGQLHAGSYDDATERAIIVRTARDAPHES